MRKWRELHLSDDDLRELENLIMEREMSAPVIRGTGGARKIRFAPVSARRGKSGAYRVIFGWFPQVQHLYLFLVYGKGERAEISEADRKACRMLMERIAAGYQKRRER